MLITITVNVCLVIITVLIHYQVLNLLSKHLYRLQAKHSFMMGVGVIGLIVAHAIEIVIFGAGYYYLLHIAGQGSMTGNFDESFIDCIYFSSVNFTTLGFGDITPTGNLRFLTGIEALTGLVLITWSASYLFLEMQRFWKN